MAGLQAVPLEPLRTRNLTQLVKFRGSQANYSGPRPSLCRGPLELDRPVDRLRPVVLLSHGPAADVAAAAVPACNGRGHSV